MALRRRLDGLATPRLLLDRPRLLRNLARMNARCAALGVALRPHLKTAKSVDVARLAGGGQAGPITVSTLAEAEYFAAAGWRDILYATAIAPAKIARAARIQRDTGARLILTLDSPAAASLVAEQAAACRASFDCVIEVDCGEHRSGAAPTSAALAAAATAVGASPDLHVAGVMTHAGHSYAQSDPAAMRAIAEAERATAVASAEMLRALGYPCPIVSVGSTPTALSAEHLTGVTEVRAGIYMVWDLAQLSRGVCTADDIAVSVLATIIGHQPSGPHLVVDAGALALSKDLSANTFLPGVNFGWVCDPLTMTHLEPLSVTAVHQEHGAIAIPGPSWFERLPIGSTVRILPNHACLTAAAYMAFDVVEEDQVIARWTRTGGW